MSPTRKHRRARRIGRALIALVAIAAAVGLFLASIGVAAVAQLAMHSEVRP